MDNLKAALVLSSGGARGIAHIGVIEELQKAGFSFSAVAGSSMGSLVGGIFARGTLSPFTAWLLHVTKMDILRFLDLTIGSGGLVKGEKIIKALEEFVGEINIEDMPLSFAYQPQRGSFS
jgi:NTE family protein